MENFYKDPTLEVLNSLKKKELIEVASHYELEVPENASKADIKKIVLDHLVEEELISEPEPSDTMRGQHLLELRRLEYQEREREREAQLRMKEIELKEMEIAMQLKLRELETRPTAPTPVSTVRSTGFDVSKHIRLVPPFQEDEVDKYFVHFEKIATSLEWPREVWTILLQSVLVGKAREIYSALPVDRSAHYDEVRKAILKAYELVPEAYRQKFRNARKQDGHTYVEFAREKEALFDRWCTAKQVDNDYRKLRQLLLVEEFKKCLQSDVKMYLDEQKADSLHQAAVLADDYSLTHKMTFPSKSDQPGVRSSVSDRKNSEADGHSPPITRSRSHGQNNCRVLAGGPVCYYCKKRGHIMAECRALERKNAIKTSNALVVPPDLATPTTQLSSQRDQCYNPFISKGFVSLSEDGKKIPIDILRDTGATQSLLVDGVLPLSDSTATGTVQIQGIELRVVKAPLHVIYLNSNLVKGTVTVGIRPTLPVKGVSLILGNDLAGSKVLPDLQLVSDPDPQQVEDEPDRVFPAYAVTRAAARRAKADQEQDKQKAQTDRVNSSTTSMSNVGNTLEDQSTDKYLSMTREQLIKEQEMDADLSCLTEEAVDEEEATRYGNCFYFKSGVLMRKWRPPDIPASDDWQVVHQIVLPRCCRHGVISVAHDPPLGGHLGVNKTYRKVLTHFYWPKMKRDIAQFCRTCHICQVVGKPNKPIPVAPLIPIPVCGEPFCDVIIDCVGPLPKTKSGNQYLLTIMCKATRFPEAVPLRNIKAPKIVNALVRFFTLVGLPRSVQSDQGSNFLSGLMQQAMYQLGVKQYKSAAYHPESQGALERFHQTIKNMLRAYCVENNRDWDQGVHLLLFAARESVQESLGFSPFELVFGRTVRGPLKLLKEAWLAEDSPVNLLDQVADLRYRLARARHFAQKNLTVSQRKMKTWYDKRAKSRHFNAGDQVLVLLPIPRQPLQARYFGPYTIMKKVNDVDYIVDTPDRRKSQRLCHINMLKQYKSRDPVSASSAACVVQSVHTVEQETESDAVVMDFALLCNSDVLHNLEKKLCHLAFPEREEMIKVITEFSEIFSDVPGRAKACCTMLMLAMPNLSNKILIVSTQES